MANQTDDPRLLQLNKEIKDLHQQLIEIDNLIRSVAPSYRAQLEKEKQEINKQYALKIAERAAYKNSTKQESASSSKTSSSGNTRRGASKSDEDTEQRRQAKEEQRTRERQAKEEQKERDRRDRENQREQEQAAKEAERERREQQYQEHAAARQAEQEAKHQNRLEEERLRYQLQRKNERYKQKAISRRQRNAAISRTAQNALIASKRQKGAQARTGGKRNMPRSYSSSTQQDVSRNAHVKPYETILGSGGIEVAYYTGASFATAALVSTRVHDIDWALGVLGVSFFVAGGAREDSTIRDIALGSLSGSAAVFALRMLGKLNRFTGQQ